MLYASDSASAPTRTDRPRLLSEEKQARDETTQENKNKRAFEELRALKLKPRFKDPLDAQPQRESYNQSILLSSLRPQRSTKSVHIDKRAAQPSAAGRPSPGGHCLPQDYRPTS